jgi:hypothetical protein
MRSISASSATTARLQRLRGQAAIVALALAALLLLASSLTVWVREQALDTDSWTESSNELLRNNEVRHALSVYLVEQVFERTDVVDELGGRLPPALRPLAGTLAANLQGSAVNLADQTLARPGVQRTWEEINRVAHQSLIAVVEEGRGRDATGDVALDMRPLLIEIRERLGLGPPKSPTAGRLVIMRSDQVDTAQTIVNTVRKLSLFLWIVVVLLFAVGIWLAQGWRRRAVLVSGWSLVAVGLILLVVRRLAGTAVVDALAGDSTAREGGEAAWIIGTTLLRDGAQGLIAYGLLAVIGCWLAGPSRSAVATRRALAPLFRKQPLAVFGGFAVVALLILLLMPGSDGRRLVGTLVLLALLLTGLEVFRRTTLKEFPPAPPAPS